jgi:hypothetical protein
MFCFSKKAALKRGVDTWFYTPIRKEAVPALGTIMEKEKHCC